MFRHECSLNWWKCKGTRDHYNALARLQASSTSNSEKVSKPKPKQLCPYETVWGIGRHDTLVSPEVLGKAITLMIAPSPSGHPQEHRVPGPVVAARRILNGDSVSYFISDPDLSSTQDIPQETCCSKEHPGLCKLRDVAVFSPTRCIQSNLAILLYGKKKKTVRGRALEFSVQFLRRISDYDTEEHTVSFCIMICDFVQTSLARKWFATQFQVQMHIFICELIPSIS